jgi:ribosomal protein S18
LRRILQSQDAQTAEKIDYINYKDVRLLAFLPERGKIEPPGGLQPRARCISASSRSRSSMSVVTLIPYVTR